MKVFFVLILLFISNAAISQNIIIPKPNKAEISTDRNYYLSGLDVSIENSIIKEDIKHILAIKLGAPTGFEVNESRDNCNIKFTEDKSLEDESYVLSVDNNGIVIKASSYGGYFYGIQTLLQLFPKEICSKKVQNIEWKIPFCKIEDGPRFMWRGVLLDVTRHWFDKKDVKRYIDEIATYKMNILHLHLSDDQGWRIQIDSYPELTRKSSMRPSRVGQWWTYERQQDGEVCDYGGFYTKEDIKELIEYAQKRNITILPEIDVPGHSMAALIAYPELACDTPPKYLNLGNKFEKNDRNVLCAGNDATFVFMDSVLKEIAELFPCKYIHIGGDECKKYFWEGCPKCKAIMESEHLQSFDELQSYFIKRIETIVHKYGKRMIGWEEILEGGIADDATLMSWKSKKGGITAAKSGHQVIMTPCNHCYIDLYQGEKSVEPATYSMMRLKDAYSFEPVPEGVDSRFIMGGQANLWTESVPTMRHAEYMTWPRTWAISESLWSKPESKNWMNFVDRVEHHFQRAEEAEINYADKSMYNAIVTPFKNGTITLQSEIDDVEMFYTFDNTIPDKYSPKYEKPLTIPKGATWLKVQSYRNGKKEGNLLVFTLSDLMKTAKK